jgi:hypothetical protein
MHRINAFVFLLAVAALPAAGTLQAQQREHARPRAMGARGMMAPDAAGRIIAMRSRLELTDDQVARLTAIQKKYIERNRTAMDRLKAARGDSTARPRAMRPTPALRDSLRQMTESQRIERQQKMLAERKAWIEAHPEIEQSRKQFRENFEAQRKEIAEVLTAEQRARLEQRMERGRKMGREGRRPGAARTPRDSGR